MYYMTLTSLMLNSTSAVKALAQVLKVYRTPSPTAVL